MTNLTNVPIKWPPYVRGAMALVVLALISLSIAGCATKPKKQPDTIKEFLSQPRPE
jgi:type IV pilus biogenesis protein CpaD/CtpE